MMYNRIICVSFDLYARWQSCRQFCVYQSRLQACISITAPAKSRNTLCTGAVFHHLDVLAVSIDHHPANLHPAILSSCHYPALNDAPCQYPRGLLQLDTTLQEIWISERQHKPHNHHHQHSMAAYSPLYIPRD